MDTTKSKMDYTERKNTLKKLLDNNILLCNGDFIVMEQIVNGVSQAVPILQFMRKIDGDDKDKTIYVASPSQVILFAAGDFYEYCQEHAKKNFLTQLDSILTQKTALLNITSKT
jgi:hypothetical protein